MMIWQTEASPFRIRDCHLGEFLFATRGPKSTETYHELKLGCYLLDLLFGGVEFIEREPDCDSKI